MAGALYLFFFFYLGVAPGIGVPDEAALAFQIPVRVRIGPCNGWRVKRTRYLVVGRSMRSVVKLLRRKGLAGAIQSPEATKSTSIV